MDSTFVRPNVMPGKHGDSVSPYLRKPLRIYEDVTRAQANRPRHLDQATVSTEPDDPGMAESPSESDYRT